MTLGLQGRTADVRPFRIALLNPNTDVGMTASMVAAARVCLPAGVEVEGRTATSGAAMITTEAALAEAAEAVVAAGVSLAAEGFDGIVVSGFGDPGLDALRTRVTMPVVGIAETAMAEAAADGRRFSVVTITPDLIVSIRETAVRYHHGRQLASVLSTPDDPLAVIGDEGRLEAALLGLCRRAIEDDGAEAIVIGGGPLAPAARAVAPMLPVPVIEPVCAAVRLLTGMLRDG